MNFEEILNIVREKFSSDIIAENTEARQPFVDVAPKAIATICEFLHGDDRLYFDHLSCLSGVDYGGDNQLGVVYHLYSIPFDHHFVLKVRLDRTQPELPSVSNIWRGADWHEREAFDLFGIKFAGHSDLRRILLPSDWEGHPLRKDYKEQEKYHGIKVEY